MTIVTIEGIVTNRIELVIGRMFAIHAMFGGGHMFEQCLVCGFIGPTAQGNWTYTRAKMPDIWMCDECRRDRIG